VAVLDDRAGPVGRRLRGAPGGSAGRAAPGQHHQGAGREDEQPPGYHGLSLLPPAVVDFVGGLPDAPLAIGRLLANQTDIGNAVKPYYGAKSGHALTVLLRDHINAAVALLEAAESGDASATAKAKAAF
jgi:hypothetical protein